MRKNSKIHLIISNKSHKGRNQVCRNLWTEFSKGKEAGANIWDKALRTILIIHLLKDLMLPLRNLNHRFKRLWVSEEVKKEFSEKKTKLSFKITILQHLLLNLQSITLSAKIKNYNWRISQALNLKLEDMLAPTKIPSSIIMWIIKIK